MNEEHLIGNTKQMTDFLGNTYTYQCLGCALGKKTIPIPGGIIYEDDDFILAADPEIPLKGFLVLTTKKHTHSIIELTNKKQHKMIEILSRANSVLKELNITKEITFIQEERAKHFHVWIFPYQDWMIEHFGKGISYVRDICEYVRTHATLEERKEVLQTIQKIKEKYDC